MVIAPAPLPPPPCVLGPALLRQAIACAMQTNLRALSQIFVVPKMDSETAVAPPEPPTNYTIAELTTMMLDELITAIPSKRVQAVQERDDEAHPAAPRELHCLQSLVQ